MGTENTIAIAKFVIPLIITILLKPDSRITNKIFFNRSKALAEMEFLSSFLSFDLKHRPRIIVEQAFSINFKYRLDFQQIAYLLNFASPYKAFRNLKNSRGLVKFDGQKFKYIESRATPFKLRIFPAIHFIIYFISTFWFLLTIAFFSYVLRQLGNDYLIVMGIGLIFSVYIAIDSIFEYAAYSAAQNLIEEQDRVLNMAHRI